MYIYVYMYVPYTNMSFWKYLLLHIHFVLPLTHVQSVHSILPHAGSEWMLLRRQTANSGHKHPSLVFWLRSTNIQQLEVPKQRTNYLLEGYTRTCDGVRSFVAYFRDKCDLAIRLYIYGDKKRSTAFIAGPSPIRYGTTVSSLTYGAIQSWAPSGTCKYLSFLRAVAQHGERLLQVLTFKSWIDHVTGRQL